MVVAIQGRQEQGISSAIGELLRVGDLAGAVATAAAGEDLHGGSGCAPGIKAYAALCLHCVSYCCFAKEGTTYQRAHNKSGVGRVVVDASRDEVEFLVQASGAWLQVDGN